MSPGGMCLPRKIALILEVDKTSDSDAEPEEEANMTHDQRGKKQGEHEGKGPERDEKNFSPISCLKESEYG
jgi:hypothetical protein